VVIVKAQYGVNSTKHRIGWSKSIKNNKPRDIGEIVRKKT